MSDQRDNKFCVGVSQMDSKGGHDTTDAHGLADTSQIPGSSIQPSFQGPVQTPVITDQEFQSDTYTKCHKQGGKVGKAVIVSNFMEGMPDQIYTRKYAKADCEKLEEALKKVGFEPLDSEPMVHQNLTKDKFTDLYRRAASVDYRKNNGHTCVLFFVMSYGQPGLIYCHGNQEGNYKSIVELKDLQEAFQPQNNSTLALKPKFFIVQTVPEPQTRHDAPVTGLKIQTKRIPREADFLTYTSDSYCIDNAGKENAFVNAFVNTLADISKDESKSTIEIQKVLIAINRKFKELRGSRKNWKIPCTTSSLTKRLYLF